MNKMNGDLKIEAGEVVELVKAEALRRLAESGLRGVTLRSIHPKKVKKHFEHPYDHRQSGDAEVDDGFLVNFECPCDDAPKRVARGLPHGGSISYGFSGWSSVCDGVPSMSEQEYLVCAVDGRRSVCQRGYVEEWKDSGGVPVIAWARVPQIDTQAFLEHYEDYSIARSLAEVDAIKAIEAALKIESLWMPPDGECDPEHADEVAALERMRKQFQEVVAKRKVS